MSLNKGDDGTSKTKKTLSENIEQVTVSNMSSSTELKSDSAEEVVKQDIGKENMVEKVLSNEELEMLKSQLSQIFSLDNFSKDKFLISQLDSDQYISIEVIAQLKAVASLSTNIPLILEILKTFPNLQVDPSNTKVRLMAPRSIIILREVPESTPKELIEKLFEGENCPQCVRCEFAGNENWYVSFLTEDDAHKAYNHLRENVQTFLGKHVMARIKTSSTFICTKSNPTNLYPQPPVVSMLPFEPAPMHPFASHNNVSFFQSDLLHAWSPKILLEPYHLKQRPFQEGVIVNPVLVSKNCEDVSPSSPGSHSSGNNQFYQPIFHPGYKHNYLEHNFTEHHNNNYNDHHHHPDNKNCFEHSRYNNTENKQPPPRFLRKQLSNSSRFYHYPQRSLHDPTFTYNKDGQSEQSREHQQSHPGQRGKWASKNENASTDNSTISNNAKNHENYQRKRYSERRGSYRMGRRARGADDGPRSSYKGRHDNNQKHKSATVKSEADTFQLETNSFPPLPSHMSEVSTKADSKQEAAISTVSNTTSISPATTTFSSKLQASYVQAVNSHNQTQCKQTNVKPTIENKNPPLKTKTNNEKRVSVTIKPSTKVPVPNQTTTTTVAVHNPLSSIKTSNAQSNNHALPSTNSIACQTTIQASTMEKASKKDTKNKCSLPSRMSYAQAAQKAKQLQSYSNVTLSNNISLNGKNNNNNNNNNSNLNENNEINVDNSDDESTLKSIKNLQLDDAASNKKHQLTNNKQPKIPLKASLSFKQNINNIDNCQAVVKKSKLHKATTKTHSNNGTLLKNGLYNKASEEEKKSDGVSNENDAAGGDDTDEYDYENYEGSNINGDKGIKKGEIIVNGSDKPKCHKEAVSINGRDDDNDNFEEVKNRRKAVIIQED